MTTQWGRFAKRSGQTIRDLGGEQAIEITNGTASHTSGEGWDYSYPDTPDATLDADTPDATLDAETRAPSAVSSVEQSGTSEDIDQLAFIDSAETVSIVPYGVPQEPPTRVTVLENGTTYEVQSDVESGDGYTRLELTEL